MSREPAVGRRTQAQFAANGCMGRVFVLALALVVGACTGSDSSRTTSVTAPDSAFFVPEANGQVQRNAQQKAMEECDKQATEAGKLESSSI